MTAEVSPFYFDKRAAEPALPGAIRPVLSRENVTASVSDSRWRQLVRLTLACGHAAYRLPGWSFGHLKRCTWCLPQSERFRLVERGALSP